jgi:hypothetical protein
MPNWCENVIFISHGNRKNIQELYIQFDDGDIINKYIPIPEGLNDIQTLEWCRENWGSKWTF